MRTRLDSLLAAPGLTKRRFILLAICSLAATSLVVAEGLRRDDPYGLLAAAYSRPAPTVEVAAAPAPVAAPAAAPIADTPAADSGSDQPAEPVTDSPVGTSAPVDTTPVTPTQTTPTTTTPTTDTPAEVKQASKIKHVFLVDIAGTDRDATWGDASAATYLNGTLKPQGVFLGGYKALDGDDRASLVALTSGQEPTPQLQQGCPDYTACTFPIETLSLPDQLNSKGLSWRAYIEDGTKPCDQASSRHNPFVYYRSLTELGDCTTNDLGFDGLANNLQTNAPNFSYIAPNLCHGGFEDPCADGSAGGVPAADAFLANLAPQILNSPAYKDDGLLVVLSSTGALAISPLLPKGGADQTEVDAYSVLRYIEDLFGLDYLGKAKEAMPLTLAVPKS